MKEFSEKYLELLTGEFAGINLTRIESPEEFYNKQILDSVLPEVHSDIFKKALGYIGRHRFRRRISNSSSCS
jgi:16S rRNA (guanine527-N7)-methyltransferase